MLFCQYANIYPLMQKAINLLYTKLSHVCTREQIKMCNVTNLCFYNLDFEKVRMIVYEGVTKNFRTGRLERELQMIHLSATRYSCIAILWVRLESFAAITLCVASQRVFIVFYFVTDAVRKLMDIPTYFLQCTGFHMSIKRSLPFTFSDLCSVWILTSYMRATCSAYLNPLYLIHAMKLLIMQSSPARSHFLPPFGAPNLLSAWFSKNVNISHIWSQGTDLEPNWRLKLRPRFGNQAGTLLQRPYLCDALFFGSYTNERFDRSECLCVNIDCEQTGVPHTGCSVAGDSPFIRTVVRCRAQFLLTRLSNYFTLPRFQLTALVRAKNDAIKNNDLEENTSIGTGCMATRLRAGR
jgi:hypothetical protein